MTNLLRFAVTDTYQTFEAQAETPERAIIQYANCMGLLPGKGGWDGTIESLIEMRELTVVQMKPKKNRYLADIN